MDGENNGKPYKNWWFGGTIIFGNTHIWISPIGIEPVKYVTIALKGN